MYWTDWGSDARIERAGMDGSNRQILHRTNLLWPNGITLDYSQQRVYWIDAAHDILEYSSMDGRGRVLLERRDDEVHHPFSLTLYNNLLFWTDWNNFTVFSTHKLLQGDSVVVVFDQIPLPPQGIEVVSSERQMDGVYTCME